MSELRKCRRCGKQKSIEEFALRSSVKKGLVPRTYCIECDVDYAVQRTEYRMNFSDEQLRDANYKKKNAQNLRLYGVTPDDIQTLGNTQNWLCAICSIDIYQKYFIDHNHTTGQVRGLLCFSCNIGLGHFRDSTDLLTHAISYLKEHTDGEA